MDGTEPRSLTDVELDRDIEAALAIEPSPEFLARVRTRVAAEPEPSRWRLAVEPLWAVAIVGIVLAIVVPQFARRDVVTLPREVRQHAGASPTGTGAGRSKVEAAAEPRGRHAVMRNAIRRRVVTLDSPEAVRTLPLQLSPVLIAENERSAFESFIAAVNGGLVPEKAIEPAPAELRELPILSIAPLDIAPLPSLARAAQEGEGQWE